MEDGETHHGMGARKSFVWVVLSREIAAIATMGASSNFPAYVIFFGFSDITLTHARLSLLSPCDRPTEFCVIFSGRLVMMN